jgi:hypothetical protein
MSTGTNDSDDSQNLLDLNLSLQGEEEVDNFNLHQFWCYSNRKICYTVVIPSPLRARNQVKL